MPKEDVPKQLQKDLADLQDPNNEVDNNLDQEEGNNAVFL